MPNARATPVSSSLALNPFSQGTASLAQSQGATTAALNGSVTATDSNGNTASSTGSATWVDAGQGSLTLSNSWNAVAGIAFFKFGDTPDKQFEYSFVADAGGSFAMSYTLTSAATPDFTGVFGFLMRMSDLTAGGSPLLGTGSTMSSRSGTLNFSLVSGHEYRFTVFGGSNFAGTSRAGR